MLLECNDFDPNQLYHLLTQLIIPRPIAWVLSDNGNGTYNLAPFSFFNAITANPPIIMFSVGWKDENTRKDTWVNIEERKDFVLHISCWPQVQDVNNTSATLPQGVSEIDEFKIPLVTLEDWPMPIVKGCKAAFLCERYAIQEVGNDPQAMILGRIGRMWVEDEAVSQGKDRIVIDPASMDPLARLGASFYSRLGDVLNIPRPGKSNADKNKGTREG